MRCQLLRRARLTTIKMGRERLPDHDKKLPPLFCCPVLGLAAIGWSGAYVLFPLVYKKIVILAIMALCYLRGKESS
jgi:hypothetical protein